jgi:MFS family permease
MLVGIDPSTSYSHSPQFLITCRRPLLQGVAGAITWSPGLAMLADTFRAGSPGMAMGITMTGVSAGSLLRPLLDGFLITKASLVVDI